MTLTEQARLVAGLIARAEHVGNIEDWRAAMTEARRLRQTLSERAGVQEQPIPSPRLASARGSGKAGRGRSRTERGQ